MARRLAGWCLGLIVFSSAVGADEPDTRLRRVLDPYIDAHAANGDFAGVVLVTRNGTPIYEKTAGLASRSFDVPIRPDTRFTVASVTKTFTAAAIALLEKQGKLKITEPLETHLPGFPPKILLWHLLGHQAGLADPDYDAIAARDVAPDELLAMIAAKPRLFEAGAQSRYGNAAYIVLARVVEKVSGKTFEDFLRESIFTPLRMTQSGTWRSGVIVPRLAAGYIPGLGDGLILPQPRDPSTLFGSGNVYSTAADLDRWLTAVDRHTLFDITKQPYPFGWGKRNWFEKSVLVQSGITNGYSSIILTVASFTGSPATRRRVTAPVGSTCAAMRSSTSSTAASSDTIMCISSAVATASSGVAATTAP